MAGEDSAEDTRRCHAPSATIRRPVRSLPEDRMTAPDDAEFPDTEPTIFGHPRALYVLFFAELWERFCYYGMRGILALHIAHEFFGHLPKEQAQAAASASYGGFTAL